MLPGRQLPALPGASIGHKVSRVPMSHSTVQIRSRAQRNGDHKEDRLQKLTLYSMTQTKALSGILKKLMMVERACSGR